MNGWTNGWMDVQTNEPSGWNRAISCLVHQRGRTSFFTLFDPVTRAYDHSETLQYYKDTSRIRMGNMPSKPGIFTMGERSFDFPRVYSTRRCSCGKKIIFNTKCAYSSFICSSQSPLCFWIYLLLIWHYLEFAPPKQTGSFSPNCLNEAHSVEYFGIASIAVCLIRSCGTVSIQHFTDYVFLFSPALFFWALKKDILLAKGP